MYRVTRKQKIVQGGNTIEFEDSCDFEIQPELMRWSMIQNEIDLGGQLYGPDKVIFEAPSFYRSVIVTIEEVQ